MQPIVRRVLLVASVLLVACETANEPPPPVDENAILDAAESLSLSVSGLNLALPLVAGRATTAAGGLERVVEVFAIETPSGKAFGRYRVSLPTLELFFTVNVTCLTVQDRTGWVAGIISDTNADFVEVGTVSYFYAIDNGRLSQGDIDIISTARFNDVDGEDLAFCADTPLALAPADVVDGNVLVLGG